MSSNKLYYPDQLKIMPDGTLRIYGEPYELPYHLAHDRHLVVNRRGRLHTLTDLHGIPTQYRPACIVAAINEYEGRYHPGSALRQQA